MPGIMTYADLFRILEELGFADTSTSEFDRSFQHAATGTILLYSMLDNATVDRRVRAADILSTEVKLEENSLLDESVRAALESHRVPKGTRERGHH